MYGSRYCTAQGKTKTKRTVFLERDDLWTVVILAIAHIGLNLTGNDRSMVYNRWL
jgi:hypothetical protein